MSTNGPAFWIYGVTDRHEPSSSTRVHRSSRFERLNDWGKMSTRTCTGGADRADEPACVRSPDVRASMNSLTMFYWYSSWLTVSLPRLTVSLWLTGSL